jgi:3-phosphoshikimate 1-carboxyvinyltransferase
MRFGGGRDRLSLRGHAQPPADKSISHRAALVGGMASEPVRITNYLDAEDTNSTLNAVRALGSLAERRDDGEIVIRGCGLRNAQAPQTAIDVGNAGTLMRLLPGWLSFQDGQVFQLDGDASIRRRPVDRVAVPLREMGAVVQATDERFPPLTVRGAALRGIDYTLPVASAQVKSCVLFAGLATERTTVRESLPSRDHTERMLLAAGAPVTREAASTGWVSGIGACDELELEHIHVPGDLSSAAFLIAAAVLVPGSRLVLENVGVNWTRAGFLQILTRMGAIVIGDLETPGSFGPTEPVCDLDVSYGPIVGATVEAAEVPLAIDELPLVALLGVFAEGETVVRDAGELRVKESDRIATVVDGLRGLGAEIEALPDGFVVQGTGRLRGGTLEAHGDHRLAMLGAVAGLASQDGVEVVGMEAAAVSYPGFVDDVARLTGA